MKTERLAEILITSLELMVALVLTITIILSLTRIIVDVASIATQSTFSKQYFVMVLDETLYMVVAIDIIRTLLSGILKKRIAIVVVIEAAMIFIIREIIALELKLVSETRLIVYGVLFLILFATWYILKKSALEERMLSEA